MLNTHNLSYWEHQSFFGPADVAIIGAGLVGLTAALDLKQRRPTWRVVVLERGALPSGASTKNAGFACFGSISELIEQEKRGDLQAVVAARCEGLAWLRGAYARAGRYGAICNGIFLLARAGLPALIVQGSRRPRFSAITAFAIRPKARSRERRSRSVSEFCTSSAASLR